MTNQKILMSALLSIVLALALISSVESRLVFFQQQRDLGNGLYQNHIAVTYDKEPIYNTQTLVNWDFTGKNDFEFYFLYDMNVKSWNLKNSPVNFSNCNITIAFSPFQTGGSTLRTLLFKNFTASDEDVSNAQYFLQMNEKDTAYADIFCKLENSSMSTNLAMPSNIQTSQPTQQCKACQFYEWGLLQASIDKAKAVGDNTSTVFTYIMKLFGILYEIIVYLFWSLLIFSIFMAIGFIFLIMFYLFKYLNNLGK